MTPPTKPAAMTRREYEQRPEPLPRNVQPHDPGDDPERMESLLAAEPALRQRDGHAEQPGRRVTLTPAASIPPRRAKWLWDRRMALGTLALLAGREGVGKSTLAYWLVAQVTRGTLPGEHHGQPRSVLVCATEDSWAHTIVPRLIAADADLHRVYRVQVAAAFGESELSLPKDIPAVGEAAAEVGAALLLMDPMMSRLSATLDTHRDAEVRQALEPLTAMLDRSGMVGLGLMHFNKSGSDDPLNALMASRAFSAVARSVSTVVRDPDDDTNRRRLFGTPKNNLGPDDLPLLSFTLAGHAVPTAEGDTHTSRIEWGPEVEGTITDALRRANDGGDRTATQEAADWLHDFLTANGGQADSAQVKKAGHAAGQSESALKRARQRLKVASESQGYPRRTVWTMPDAAAQSGQPSRVTPGESELTDLTEPTGGSRSSRSSQTGPPEREPTGGDALALLAATLGAAPADDPLPRRKDTPPPASRVTARVTAAANGPQPAQNGAGTDARPMRRPNDDHD